MDYFVTVVPSYQHFWQIELLIESFKILKMQDKLLVAIVGSPSALPVNLLNHPRKIFCPDFNEACKCNYPSINKIACLKIAIDHLDTCFTMLHPDMVVIAPLNNIEHNICFNPYPPKQDVFGILKLPPDFTWISFDGTTIFNRVPIEFFDYVLNTTKTLVEIYGTNWSANFAAWNFATHQYSQSLSFIGTTLETPLTSTSCVLSPIIHYKTGLPPYFSKNFQITDDPYNTLLNFNPNFCTNSLRAIVLSYKNIT